jgi:uncharacterized protein YaiL (DUF2058 family)
VSKSIQDQLLALGLAKENVGHKKGGKPGGGGKSRAETARKASQGHAGQHKSPRHKSSKDNGLLSKGDDGAEISLEQAYRIRQNTEKNEKRRRRELKMERDRQRAELNRAIKAIVDAGRVNSADAAEARYFMYKNRIRKIYLTPLQLEQLNQGELGLVYLMGGYHVMPKEQVEAVRALSPDHVPDLAGGDDDEADFARQEEKDRGSDQGQ